MAIVAKVSNAANCPLVFSVYCYLWGWFISFLDMTTSWILRKKFNSYRIYTHINWVGAVDHFSQTGSQFTKSELSNPANILVWVYIAIKFIPMTEVSVYQRECCKSYHDECIFFTLYLYDSWKLDIYTNIFKYMYYT